MKEYVKKKFEIARISLFQCACYLGTLQFYKATCSRSFIYSHFLCQSLSAVCADYFDYFLRFVKNFLCYFFQKQATKDHLTQGNLLKTTLLNEKQSNLDKEMYGNIFFLSLRRYLRNLQSDQSSGVQYWPYLYSAFSICIFLLNKKKSTFNSHSAKIEMYSLKTN